MCCNCKWTEIILAVVILIFAFWQTVASKWIIVIAAIVLLLHALMCKNCANCDVPAAKVKAKKRR
jgi:type IV secretory pathway TrbL component